MRFLFINHMQNARQSLRSNRMRSTLTMLGVTIGVASITIILSLSGGASQIVSTQVDSLGGNIAVIRPGTESETPLQDIAESSSTQRFAASTLTAADTAAIQRVENVAYVAPMMVLSGAVKSTKSDPVQAPIVATTPDLADISGLEVRSGEFINPDLPPNTAVVGAQLSVNVFGTEASIGKMITVRGETFRITGILKRTNTPINYNGVDFDEAVIISQESGRLLNQGALPVSYTHLTLPTTPYV